MESGGIPGSVHISHETYINLTGCIDQFHVEPGNGGDRDKLLKEKNVTTYLIRPKLNRSISNTNISSAV